jgi:hypothetical protein
MKPEYKLLSGYAYRIADVSPTINTGIGGAKMLIDSFRAKGLSDSEIELAIEVYTHGMWVALAYVNHKKITEDDNKPIA